MIKHKRFVIFSRIFQQLFVSTKEKTQLLTVIAKEQYSTASTRRPKWSRSVNPLLLK